MTTVRQKTSAKKYIYILGGDGVGDAAGHHCLRDENRVQRGASQKLVPAHEHVQPVLAEHVVGPYPTDLCKETEKKGRNIKVLLASLTLVFATAIPQSIFTPKNVRGSTDEMLHGDSLLYFHTS